MTELVQAPETKPEAGKKKGLVKERSAKYGFRTKKSCDLTDFSCRGWDCRRCFLAMALVESDDPYNEEVDRKLQDALQELEATKLQLKALDSMKAIMARAGRDLIEQEGKEDAKPQE